MVTFEPAKVEQANGSATSYYSDLLYNAYHHHVLLKELKLSTKYYYTCGGDEKLGEERSRIISFKTRNRKSDLIHLSK